jgi:hypothetical protein
MRHSGASTTLDIYQLSTVNGRPPESRISSLGRLQHLGTMNFVCGQMRPTGQTEACKLLKNGGQGRNRTADASLFRAALYQLSYLARIG